MKKGNEIGFRVAPNVGRRAQNCNSDLSQSSPSAAAFSQRSGGRGLSPGGAGPEPRLGGTAVRETTARRASPRARESAAGWEV